MLKKTLKIVDLLQQLYPEPRSELNFKGEYQLVVAVLLSAQCTDKKVNQVTPSLFRHYPDFSALRCAKLQSVEEIIRPINYYRTKAKNLLALANAVDREFKGKLPKSFDQLIQLAGVGRKTANVVLGELGIAHTLPVDTHVLRVSNRLGLANASTPDKVEQQLRSVFPSTLWRNLHHQLIFHGRRVCIAQRPKCSECQLRKLCEYAKEK